MKSLSFDDISLVPGYNSIASRKDVDTSVQFGALKLKIPVMSSNMDTITDSKMASKIHSLGGIGFLHRFCSIQDNIEMYLESTARTILNQGLNNEYIAPLGEAVISIGVNEGLNRFKALYRVGARYFCIDVAHGHSKAVGDTIKAIKEFYSDAYIVAGNVCTVDGAQYLVECGADAIKVGIGPGSVCSTRIKTGFGVPQFTAIKECSFVDAFIIADGGIRTPGDAVKAFAAGADAVMLGGMLSGTDETPGDIIEEKDPTDIIGAFGASTYTKLSGLDHSYMQRSLGKFKIFRGMASKEAQEDYMGSMTDWKTAEGVEIRVTAKGPVANVVSDLMGGIRSGMTYCGASNIKELRQKANWVEVSAAGTAEGKPHGEGRL